VALSTGFALTGSVSFATFAHAYFLQIGRKFNEKRENMIKKRTKILKDPNCKKVRLTSLATGLAVAQLRATDLARHDFDLCFEFW
jgi:hypothetical protein